MPSGNLSVWKVHFLVALSYSVLGRPRVPEYRGGKAVLFCNGYVPICCRVVTPVFDTPGLTDCILTDWYRNSFIHMLRWHDDESE